MATKYKYRAWRIDRNGDPQDGVEEEFIARKTQHPDTTAFIMACKALDLRAGESVWLECCFTRRDVPTFVETLRPRGRASDETR